MNELIELNNKVRMLYECAKMLTESNFKSVEAKSFNEGAKFAYKNILKLISEQVKEKNNE